MDYSKWANMTTDDDEDDESPPRKPRVTRLEGPSRITLGGGQRQEPPPACYASAAPAAPTATQKRVGTLGEQYAKWDHFVEEEDGSDEEPTTYDEANDWEDPLDDREQARLREVLHGSSSAAPTPSSAASSSSRGSAFETLRARLTRNGAARERHLWGQTESEVEVSVLLPAGTRAKDLRPDLVAADPLSGTKQRLVVHRMNAKGAEPLFSDALAYPVAQPESAEDLAWEVSDYEPSALNGRRVLRLTFRKEAPHGIVLWWERCFMGEEKCDTQVFPDRRHAGKAEQIQSVWAEAQRMFKEKVANRKPVEIDMGEAVEDAEELDAAGEGVSGHGAAVGSSSTCAGDMTDND